VPRSCPDLSATVFAARIALRALPALRWMDYYGKGDVPRVVMSCWCEVIMREGFYQQVDTDSGEFIPMEIPGRPRTMFDGYSHAALSFPRFAKRLGQARREIR
jgi:hypothetical protein